MLDLGQLPGVIRMMLDIVQISSVQRCCGLNPAFPTPTLHEVGRTQSHAVLLGERQKVGMMPAGNEPSGAPRLRVPPLTDSAFVQPEKVGEPPRAAEPRDDGSRWLEKTVGLFRSHVRNNGTGIEILSMHMLLLFSRCRCLFAS
jgi:hypothetical protein